MWEYVCVSTSVYLNKCVLEIVCVIHLLTIMFTEVAIILVFVSSSNCEKCNVKSKMEKLLQKEDLKKIQAKGAKSLDGSNQE